MADSSMGLHEAREDIAPETLDRHRSIVSLMEELEAMDWYDQRIDAADDAELKDILAHNRTEETEHASMTLEWLRRHDPALDKNLRSALAAMNLPSTADVEMLRTKVDDLERLLSSVEGKLETLLGNEKQ